MSYWRFVLDWWRFWLHSRRMASLYDLAVLDRQEGFIDSIVELHPLGRIHGVASLDYDNYVRLRQKEIDYQRKTDPKTVFGWAIRGIAS